MSEQNEMIRIGSTDKYLKLDTGNWIVVLMASATVLIIAGMYVTSFFTGRLTEVLRFYLPLVIVFGAISFFLAILSISKMYKEFGKYSNESSTALDYIEIDPNEKVMIIYYHYQTGDIAFSRLVFGCIPLVSVYQTRKDKLRDTGKLIFTINDVNGPGFSLPYCDEISEVVELLKPFRKIVAK